MTNQEEEIIEVNARKAAALYKRRCWWASVEDMQQEARTAQLEALERGGFDESWGRPLSAYLWTVAFYAVRRLVLKASAPVSTHYRLDKLIGLHRSPTEFVGESGEVREVLVSSAQDAESLVEAHRCAQRVRARVETLLGARNAAFVFGVMTGEYRPEEIAEAHSMPLQRVREAQKHCRKVLQDDAVLFDLWRDAS